MTASAGATKSWENLLPRTVKSHDPVVLLVNPVKGAPGTRGNESSVVAYADTVSPSYLYGTFQHTFPAEPLYFNLIAAQLRHAGISCEIVDGFCHRFDVTELADVIRTFNPKIVAFAVFHNTLSETLAAARVVKAWRPEVVTVIGSAYASPHWAQIVRAQEVDFVVVGDGEVALTELATALRDGRETDAIAGVASKVEGRPRLVPPVPIADLDELAFPVRDLMPLIRQDEYGVSMYSSRGCAFGKCTFCYLLPYQKAALQPKWRARTPENVVAEMAALVAEFGVSHVTFVDEDYFGSNSEGIDRTVRIAELLLEREIPVHYYVNALIRSLLQIKRKGLLPLFAQSGLDSVFTGFESASRTTLQQFHKPQLPSQYEEVIDGLMEHGIRINPGLITFTPTCSLADLRENALLAQRMRYYDLYLFSRRLVDLEQAPDLARAQSMAAPLAQRGWQELFAAEHTDILGQFVDPRVASVFQMMRALCSFLQSEFSAACKAAPQSVRKGRDQAIERHYESFAEAIDLVELADSPSVTCEFALSWASEASRSVASPLYGRPDPWASSSDTAGRWTSWS